MYISEMSIVIPILRASVEMRLTSSLAAFSVNVATIILDAGTFKSATR